MSKEFAWNDARASDKQDLPLSMPTSEYSSVSPIATTGSGRVRTYRGIIRSTISNGSSIQSSQDGGSSCSRNGSIHGGGNSNVDVELVRVRNGQDRCIEGSASSSTSDALTSKVPYSSNLVGHPLHASILFCLVLLLIYNGCS